MKQIDLEKSIVGSMMFDNELISEIEPKWFRNNECRKVAEVIIETKSNDIATICDKSKVDIDKVTEIMNRFETYSIALDRVKLLKKSYREYSITKVINEANKDINSMDIDKVIKKLESINIESLDISDGETFKEIVISLATELSQEVDKKKNQTYSFPIPMLNYYLYQLENHWMVTIAAKSGKGKTALAMQIALSYMKRGLKVLIISREMSQAALVKRMILHDIELEPNKLKSRDFTDDERKRVNDLLFKEYSKFNSWIDTESRTVNQIKNKIDKYKPDIVFIDYIQLLKSEGKTREQEVAAISREIKEMTLDYNIPMVVMAQLNDNMGYHRPKGDTPMRESKAIYHDSNVVIYIHEPIEGDLSEYDKANIATDENMKLFEIIVDKNREGQIGRFPAYYFGKRLKFVEIQ